MIGTHKTVIDAKSRINIPSKIRESLGERFFITVSLADNCLTIYLPNEYEALKERINALPKTKSADIRRILFGNACECEPDKQGRVLLPSVLRDYARITDEVVILGLEDSAEIWSREELDKKNASISMENIKNIAMELDI